MPKPTLIPIYLPPNFGWNLVSRIRSTTEGKRRILPLHARHFPPMDQILSRSSIPSCTILSGCPGWTTLCYHPGSPVGKFPLATLREDPSQLSLSIAGVTPCSQGAVWWIVQGIGYGPTWTLGTCAWSKEQVSSAAFTPQNFWRERCSMQVIVFFFF